MLTENKKAPAFSLPNKDGKKVALKDVKSKYTVVYFYPKDSTPGCTIEANEFSKLKPRFDKQGTTIIGISGGDDKSKAKFCEKNKLTITLLGDTDFMVSKKYGVYGEKKFMGRSFDGIKRVTFILDENKKVIKVFENVKALGHAKAVFSFIETA